MQVRRVSNALRYYGALDLAGIPSVHAALVLCDSRMALTSERNKFMSRLLPRDKLEELTVQADAESLMLSDLAATREKFSVTPQDVLNELSLLIAEDYLLGTLTYEFCDSVMNGIINAIVEVAMTNAMPQPAFSLYQAFDAGEWIRSDDPPGTDPSEKYTRPAVQEILRTYRESLLR